MDILKNLAYEFLMLDLECNNLSFGERDTLREIQPLVKDLKKRVEELYFKSENGVIRYFTKKLYVDILDLDKRINV